MLNFEKELRLHFGVLAVTCHAATIHWQLCSAVCYTVENV